MVTLQQLFGCFRKLMRHTKFSYGNLNLHPWIINVTQDFNDPTYSLGIACRLLYQLNTDYLPSLRLSWRSSQQDILTEAIILRGDDPDPIFVEQTTNHVRISALYNFNDATF